MFDLTECRERTVPFDRLQMAEGEGFEPSVPCDTPVFKTGAIDHSATPPEERGEGREYRGG